MAVKLRIARPGDRCALSYRRLREGAFCLEFGPGGSIVSWTHATWAIAEDFRDEVSPPTRQAFRLLRTYVQSSGWRALRAAPDFDKLLSGDWNKIPGLPGLVREIARSARQLKGRSYAQASDSVLTERLWALSRARDEKIFALGPALDAVSRWASEPSPPPDLSEAQSWAARVQTTLHPLLPFREWVLALHRPYRREDPPIVEGFPFVSRSSMAQWLRRMALDIELLPPPPRVLEDWMEAHPAPLHHRSAYPSPPPQGTPEAPDEPPTASESPSGPSGPSGPSEPASEPAGTDPAF